MNYYNYFTEIEEHFVRRRGKHLLISPMDWALISTWRDAGIPLNVALRGIDIAMDGFFGKQHRGTSKVNSLCYCHDAVMAEYAAHLESHLGESSKDGPTASLDSNAGLDRKEGPSIEETTGLISARIGEIKALSAKQYPESAPEGLNRVLTRLEEVLQNRGSEVDPESLERDLGIIDNLLISELRVLVSPEEMIEWEQEAKKELKVYKKRLPRETYDKIRDNFMHDKIRRKFNIGELSLFHL
jgi:hypothetical protein